MELDPSIYFILIVPDGRPKQASPMQGFAISLCQNSWAIQRAAMLPTTIYDLTEQGRETLLARRMSGNFPVHWHGQSPNAIRSMPHPSFLPFALIILPETELPQHYSDWASRSPLRPTIVAKSGGDLTYSDLTSDRLQKHFLSICDRIPQEVDSASIESARNALKEWRPMPSRQLGYRVGGHNSVTPNLVALTVAGFEDMVEGPFKNIQHGIKPYVDQIVRTSISILEERDRIGERDLQRIFRPAPDVNLFAPSIYPDFMKLRLRDDVNREEKRRFQALCRILDRQQGYAFELSSPAQQMALMGNAFVESRGASKPTPHPLMTIRAQELRLATDAMAAFAASEFSTVVRMPNEINRTVGSVRAFSQHYRGDRRNARKRLLAFRQVQARLAAAFPTEFLDLIRRSKTGIRVVSDAHLEWLDVDGLPLAIRKICSRIPVTPGNLFIDSVTSRPLVHLTPEDFKDVLVISALKRRDPIRGLFETAFAAFEPHWQDKLTVQFAEVATRDELVRVLNDFGGPMVVFDGHGSHEHGEPAKLHLQDEAVDIWSLSGEVKSMPPIVILSACDTHAADRNHATTANGFMHLGARTVLSSVFPLDAVSAAVFSARLVFRVAAFLGPAITSYDEGLTWSEVVSGMLRMHLLTDFLRLLVNRDQLDQQSYVRIHERGNFAINNRALDPFGIVTTELEKLGLAKDAIAAGLETAVANSSVISYLQIGRPETILIDSRDRMQRQLESYQSA